MSFAKLKDLTKILSVMSITPYQKSPYWLFFNDSFKSCARAVFFTLFCFCFFTSCLSNPYKRLNRFELKAYSGHLTELVHKRSGARIVLLKNSDPARSFTIAFRTPPYDNTGLFHVLEHAALKGSRLYPSKSNISQVRKSSPADFINAMTLPVYTRYHFVTRSKKDFENLLSVYMDAVFFPKAVTDPRIIQREGRRYEINPKTGKMSLNGIVFNEMRGRYGNPLIIFRKDLMAPALLPDTPYAYNSSGHPEQIAALQFQQIQEAHKKYYHPQNALIFLYGDLDFKKTLEVIDQHFLSLFNRDEGFKPPAISRQGDLPGSPLSVIKTTYPGPKGEGKDWIAEGWTIGPLNLTEQTALGIMLEAFASHSTAPLKLSALKKGLAQSVFAAYYPGRDNAIAFVFKGADESKTKRLQAVLNEELKRVIDEGLNEKLLTLVFNQYVFQYQETQRNGTRKGYNMGWDIISHWLDWSKDIPLSQYLDIQNRFKETKKLLADKQFVKDFFKKHFKENPNRRALLMTPDPHFFDQFNKRISQQTASALQQKPISEYQKEDRLFREWVSAKESEDITNKIPVLALSDIETDDQPIPFRRYKNGSYEVMEYPSATEGISYMRLFFDLQGVREEDIKLLRLFAYLLKKTDTEHYPFQELSQKIDTFIGDWDFDIETFQSAKDPKRFKAFLKVSLIFLNENRAQSFELLKEVLIHSQFSPESRALHLLNELKTTTADSLVDEARYLVAGAAQRSFFPSQGGFSDLASGGLFLEHLLKSNWDSRRLVARFQSLLKDIFNQSRLRLAALISEEKELKTLVPLMEELKSALPVKASKDQDHSFTEQKNYNAYILPVGVQYLAKTTSFKNEGLEYNGALEVYSNYMNMHFMHPRLREEGGAYGAWSYFQKNGLWTLGSSRDPHLKKSFDIFAKAVDFMSQDIDERKLKASVMGALKPFYRDQSTAGRADFMTSLYLRDLSWDDHIQTKKEILATRPESFERINQALSAALKTSQKAAVGPADKIKTEADFAKEALSLSCRELFSKKKFVGLGGL